MDDIIEDIRSITLATSLYDAATALFCYDYCLTFGREVQYIWPLRLSVPSLLFFAVRYPALVNTAFIILDQTCWRGMTDESCTIMVRTQMALNLILLISAAFFSGLRAYALCGRSRAVLVLVLLLGLVNPSISLVTFIRSDTALFSYPVRICGFYSAVPGETFENWMVIARTSSVVADGLVLAITWSKTWNVRREAPPMNFASKITMVLMRDGTFYFTILLIINLVALSLSRAFQLIEAISTWIAVVTSIMMSRFILDLHAAARLHTVDDTSSPLTPPVFATAGTSVSSFFGVLTTDISVEPMDALSRASADI